MLHHCNSFWVAVTVWEEKDVLAEFVWRSCELAGKDRSANQMAIIKMEVGG